MMADPMNEATMRENMISKAIEFLQHPKVQSSPVAQRRKFLAKKGLSESEIEEAVQRSGVQDSPPAVAPQQAGTLTTTQQAVALTASQPAAPRTLWARTKDVTVVCVLIGGVSYGFYQLLKKFVLPLWLGPSPEELQLAAVQQAMMSLQTELQKLSESMHEVQQVLTQQQETVKHIVSNAAMEKGGDAMQRINDTNSLRDIKSEITSLKGLLLSRNQFPKTPRSQPVLPSWQLTSSTEEHSNIPAEDKIETAAGASTVGSRDTGSGTEVTVSENDSKLISGDPSHNSDRLQDSPEVNATGITASFEAVSEDDNGTCSDTAASLTDSPSSTETTEAGSAS